MFCPICKCEYREGFAVCSDCNTALVAELPLEKEEDKRQVNEDEFVEIGWYSNPARIAFLNSVFEAREIDFYVLNDHGLLGIGTGARFFVAKKDLSSAEEILKDISFDDTPWYVK